MEVLIAITWICIIVGIPCYLLGKLLEWEPKKKEICTECGQTMPPKHLSG